MCLILILWSVYGGLLEIKFILTSMAKISMKYFYTAYSWKSLKVEFITKF